MLFNFFMFSISYACIILAVQQLISEIYFAFIQKAIITIWMRSTITIKKHKTKNITYGYKHTCWEQAYWVLHRPHLPQLSGEAFEQYLQAQEQELCSGQRRFSSPTTVLRHLETHIWHLIKTIREKK